MVFKRDFQVELKASAASYPIMTIIGPRQSGNTTLAKISFPDLTYVNLEAPDKRAFALADPKGFIEQCSGGVILDEIQNSRELLSYIQVMVD